MKKLTKTKLYFASIATVTIIAGLSVVYGATSGWTSSTGILFPTGSSACTAGNEGEQRYNATSKAMEYCNGSGWVAVSAGAAGGASYGTPGYYTLPNGLKIQWGTGGTTCQAETTNYVSFPSSFTTAVYNVAVTPHVSSWGLNDDSYVQFQNSSKTAYICDSWSEYYCDPDFGGCYPMVGGGTWMCDTGHYGPSSGIVVQKAASSGGNQQCGYDWMVIGK